MRNLAVKANRFTYFKAWDPATKRTRYIPAIYVAPMDQMMCNRVFPTATEAKEYAKKVQRRYTRKYRLYRQTLYIKQQYEAQPWYRKLQWRLKKIYYERTGKKTILSLLDARV